MFVVDTNVLVYASNLDIKERDRCRALLDLWRAQATPWHATWPILYEFSRVVTHPRVLQRPYTIEQAWRFVGSLLSSPGFQVLAPTSRHHQVAAALFAEIPGLAGSILHDTHTVVLMREHGIRRIYTRDADFRRFPHIEVVDPLPLAGD